MNSARLIVITGPESSGKSFLGEKLTRFLDWPLISEFARTYLDQLNRPYIREDLLPIAQGQYTTWTAQKHSGKGMIMDTDGLTIKIWSEEKYQRCDPEIIDLWKKNLPDLYLLCRPDIPWEADPLRENPKDRERLFDWYEKELLDLGVPYFIVEGDFEQRLEKTKEFVQVHFNLLN